MMHLPMRTGFMSGFTLPMPLRGNMSRMKGATAPLSAAVPTVLTIHLILFQ
jgi:hypothetical protein